MAEGMQRSLKMCLRLVADGLVAVFVGGSGVGGVAYLHGLTFLTFRMQKLHFGAR